MGLIGYMVYGGHAVYDDGDLGYWIDDPFNPGYVELRPEVEEW